MPANDSKPKLVSTKEDIEKNKIYAVLSYLGILIIIPFLVEDAKKSTFAKFHMNQGLVLLIVSFALSVAWVVPVIGWIVGFFGGIALFVIWIMALISAIKGDMTRMPLLGDIEIIK